MLVVLPVGETTALKEGLFLGRGDYPLSEEGIGKIKDAGESFSGYIFDKAFSSPAAAARETLELFLGNGASCRSDPVFDEALHDRSGGIYEGEKYNELKKKLSPKAYKLWERDQFESPPSGESFLDMKDRILPWFRENVENRIKANEMILAVSHPDAVRTLISILRGDPWEDVLRFPIENGLPIITNDIMP